MPDPGSPDLSAKRNELVSAHQDVFASTLAVMTEVDETAWQIESGCPGWSVQDLLSHMIGMERLMLGDPFPDHVVDPKPAHVKDAFGAHTEVDVDLRRGRSRQALLDEARATFDRRAASLDALSADDMAGPVPGPFGTDVAVKVLGTRLFDLYAHEQDIRRATDRLGHQQGPAANVFWKRSSRGLAMNLQRDIQDVGAVRFVIDDPEQRELLVELGDGPGVNLTMDWSTWVGLVCGRADARPDRVNREGDADTDRILASMGITP